MRQLSIWATTFGVIATFQLLLPALFNADSLHERAVAQESPAPTTTPSPSPEPAASPTPEATPTPETTPTPAPSPDASPAPVPTPQEGSTLLNQQGELQTGDSVLASDGSLYDEYTFDGEEGQQITITLESSEFDTYLAVFTPDNKLLQEHDDINQNNSNSQITVTLPVSGTYRVIVNAYDSKGKGKYLLKVQ